MTPQRFQSSLAAVAGGFFAFAILTSGFWYPKAPAGGLTQVGREASVTFEDGSVMSLSESANDLDILKKRRMHGWKGHEFRQTYILADGREIEVTNNRPGVPEESEDLDSGDHMILTANDAPGAPVKSALDGAKDRLGKLQIDGTYRVAGPGGDQDGWIYINTIAVADAKDQVFTDPKDRQPATSDVSAEKTLAEQSLEWFMRGGPNYLGMGSLMGNNGTMSGGVNNNASGNGGGVVSLPPIGAAIPEPSTLALAGVAGALGLALRFRPRRCS